VQAGVQAGVQAAVQVIAVEEDNQSNPLSCHL
jgi:hypothetical protein